MDRSLEPCPASGSGLRRTRSIPEACFWPTSGSARPVRHVSVSTSEKSQRVRHHRSSSAGSALPKIALKQKPWLPNYQQGPHGHMPLPANGLRSSE